MELKNILTRFRDLTLEIKKAVENEDFDLMDELIAERQKCIEETQKLSYGQEEFREITLSLNIIELQGKVDNLVREKQRELKEKIEQSLKETSANMGYNNEFFSKNTHLNKQA